MERTYLIKHVIWLNKDVSVRLFLIFRLFLLLDLFCRCWGRSLGRIFEIVSSVLGQTSVFSAKTHLECVLEADVEGSLELELKKGEGTSLVDVDSVR